MTKSVCVFCGSRNGKGLQYQMYHCPAGDNAQHPDGFDICLACINELKERSINIIDMVRQYMRFTKCMYILWSIPCLCSVQIVYKQYQRFHLALDTDFIIGIITRIRRRQRNYSQRTINMIKIWRIGIILGPKKHLVFL